MKAYRIKSRTRFTLFVFILAVLIFSTGGFIFNNTVSGMDVDQLETIEVNPGDTLWDIAANYNEEGKDVREFVHELCTINEIDNGSIQPGDMIKVPVTIAV